MLDNLPLPPRRNPVVLRQWVDDFIQASNVDAADVAVIDQDNEDTTDTGLVVIHLRKANASVYMQPRGYNDPSWEITLTARQEDLTVPPHELGALGAEIVVAANLCAYLQYRSLEWDRERGKR